MVRGVQAKRVQGDEIWSFCYAKKKNVAEDEASRSTGAGDVWTWTAIDADSKLCVSYLVGARTAELRCDSCVTCESRLANRIQLTTDATERLPRAVDRAFGVDVDYAMLHQDLRRRARGRRAATARRSASGREDRITGDPDPKHISTSYVERSNLTMRMHMRRFTRLTNAFSKKFENHAHMVALYSVWYNCPHSQDAARDARDGGWPDRPRLGFGRDRGPHGRGRQAGLALQHRVRALMNHEQFSWRVLKVLRPVLAVMGLLSFPLSFLNFFGTVAAIWLAILGRWNLLGWAW